MLPLWLTLKVSLTATLMVLVVGTAVESEIKNAAIRHHLLVNGGTAQ